MPDARNGLNGGDANGGNGERAREVLRRQLASAEEAERRRLARELHDQLGQQLTALSLGLSELANMLVADSVASARLASLQRLAGALVRDVRYIAVELRPPELDDVGLESAMSSYVTLWTQRYGIPVDLEIAGGLQAPLTPDANTALFRIMQEALTNVAKHAAATRVSVTMDHAADETRLIIEDDGRGFEVEPTAERALTERRFGLAGMQERAALGGGDVEIESKPGAGTTVYARLRHEPAEVEHRSGRS